VLALRDYKMQNNYYAGHYQVGTQKFTNKIMAAITATDQKQPMTWHFHDDIFSKVKPVGVSNIKELYKQRALQLREKYDYLILNYSGGSDSWTVLNTFLENNIKLDHIFVKWPMKAMDKGFYTPNNVDRSAFNFVSEWDFTLKKDLEWLAQAHPEITIEIGDWLDNLDNSYFNDDLFSNAVNYSFMTNLLRCHFGSDTERNMVDKGLKVGSIYGVDKPWVAIHGNKCFFYFMDGATTTCPVRQENPEGTEYFYWTPDMPQIAVEQAYKVYQWHKNNKQMRHTILELHLSEKEKELAINKYMKNFEESSDIVRSLIYPDWDFSRFQAFKPIPIPEFEGKQKDFWLENRQEVSNTKDAWRHHWRSYFDKIHPSFLYPNKELKKSITKMHYLGDI
jgi:hypothetical protein